MSGCYARALIQPFCIRIRSISSSHRSTGSERCRTPVLRRCKREGSDIGVFGLSEGADGHAGRTAVASTSTNASTVSLRPSLVTPTIVVVGWL